MTVVFPVLLIVMGCAAMKITCVFFSNFERKVQDILGHPSTSYKYVTREEVWLTKKGTNQENIGLNLRGS